MPTIAPAFAHLSVVDTRDPESNLLPHENHALAPPGPQLRVGLSPLDRLALTGLASDGDVQAIIGWVTDSATALAGPDREASRLRLISRAVATQRARELVYEAMLDERLLARDFEGATAINKILTETTKRLARLLREHQAACLVGHHDVVVAVAHVDQINVATKK